MPLRFLHPEAVRASDRIEVTAISIAS